jgi:ADP-ribose pyrophosphatase
MTENKPDAEEHDIAVRSVPVADFERMMLEGKIRDGCTHAAWALYLMWKAHKA